MTGDTARVLRIPDCDLTHDVPEPAVYDGKTQHGPWAYMCEEHMAQHGVGLGTGRGQRLILQS